METQFFGAAVGLNRVRTSRSDLFGLRRAAAFGNSLADSVSFRVPSRPTPDGSPLLRRCPL
jgi:hypothetical protein